VKLNAVVAQFPVSLSIPSNLEMIDSVLEQTDVGSLVVFPEGAVSGYSTDTTFLQKINGTELNEGLEHIRREAERRRINVWVGACINLGGAWFNTAQGFSSSGETHIYRKINLATHERGTFSKGNHLPVFELNTPEGATKIGVQICRELRFAEQWNWLARCGAQVIFNAIGIDTVQPVWKSHLISRAAELQRFVLSANNAASKQISPTIAIAPNGQVVGEIVSAEVGVLRIELDLSKVSDLYLNQNRSDVITIAPGNAQNAA
jgi:predicted amidohydrolase